MLCRHMVKDLVEILQSADWFPFRLAESGDVTFVRLSDSERRLATFLHERCVSPNAPRATISLAAIREAGPLPQGPLHFLFHTSFCGSTLLAHAFGATSSVVSYSEPQILNDLGALAVGGKLDQEVLTLVIALLGAKRHGRYHCLIKPTNELNFLLPVLMNARADARAIFISSALDDFLYSIARKGLPGRVWVRGQYRALRRRAGLTLGFSESEILEQSDMQVAALFWIQNRALFRSTIQAGGRRYAGLESVEISRNLEDAVSRVARFFGIGLSEEDLRAAALQGRRDVKRTDSEYDPMARDREREGLKAVIGNEIDLVVQWASKVADHARIITALPAAA